SKIEEYDPGFRSPWYPWLHIAGMIISVFLILEMGLLSIMFTALIAVFSVGWYFYYAHHKIEREGAIFHVHARLGKRRYRGLEHEMRTILREKGLRDEDPYEEVVARATVIEDMESSVSYSDIIKTAVEALAESTGVTSTELTKTFYNANKAGAIPIGRGVALNHVRVEQDIHAEMVLIRISDGIEIDTESFESLSSKSEGEIQKIRAFIFLVSSEQHSGSHLRILAHIAEMVDTKHFMQRWLSAKSERELREVMLRDEHFINLYISKDDSTSDMIGKEIKDIKLPGDSLIAIVEREGDLVIPHGDTVIRDGDKISVIGSIDAIDQVKQLKRNS
ncbi:MAG: PTS sugar transporter subunit IIA, partial [Candidatus Cyclobacteriaceae bacterium M2_1C_046]